MSESDTVNAITENYIRSMTEDQWAEYINRTQRPHDPHRPYPAPLLGYPVRRIRKDVPYFSAKRDALLNSTIIVDTYGHDGFEQVVVNWPVLEELIDEVVEYRRLIAHCRGLDTGES